MALSAYYICFTGFYEEEEEDEYNDENANHTSIHETGIAQGGSNGSWTLRRIQALAESLGATVQTHITKRTTVLVARQGLTRKRLVAEQHHIPVVSPRWIESHGRISFADARLLPLAGYTFCATQMTTDEEKALTSIIERHGGGFDRTLTARTSMLFVPHGWFKQWQQQQQRVSGRFSTAPQGAVASSALPEKIRFAWATDIPIVEYTRFLTMTALGDSAGAMGDGNNGEMSVRNMKTPLKTDFDTIAKLCAIPISVAGGAVPHTQPNTALPPTAATVVVAANSDNGEGDGESKDADNNIKQIHVEVQSVTKKSMTVKHEIDTLQDTQCDNQNTSTLTGSLHEAKGMTAVHPSCSLSTTGILGHHKIINSNKSVEANANHFFFTQSSPFLQVALLGCTARELVDCIRMTVSCRFLRTSIVTPLTDVVVVGSELLLSSPEGTNNGIPTGSGKNRHLLQKYQPQGQMLTQLRGHLCASYGVPVERIVTIAWLQTCYQRMMLLHASHNMSATTVTPPGVTQNTYFFPLPLPLKNVPPTEQFNIHNASTVSIVEVPQQESQQQPPPQQPPPQPQPSEVPLSCLRTKRTAPTEPLPIASKRSRYEAALPDTLLNVDKQYNAELHLAGRRVKDLLELLDTSPNPDEDVLPPFAFGLFCFLENDFSRLELAVVRALIKHGGGIWMKRTRDDWTKALTRTGATVETTTTTTTTMEGGQEEQAPERELLAFVRRRSVFHKRLCRAQANGDAAATRSLIQPDTRHARKLSPSLPDASRVVIAMYVVPHGDQRPSDSLLRKDGRRSSGPQWHPLRYLPAVTQDYVVCCLAAQRMLHPSSCFIFYQTVPTRNERLARRRCRSEVGKPLTLSRWLGQKRHEKAPLVDISVYFLCIMEDEVSATTTALRRVLVSCLKAAVNELGGHATEVLLPEATTHVVVVDVASIMASGPLTETSEILPWLKLETLEDCEGLLTQNVFWPQGMPNAFLHDLMGIASTGRVSIVGMEWLHASVAWGVFLDETPYLLPITCNAHPEQQERVQGYQETPYNVECATVTFSTTTPPVTPSQRKCAGINDVTLLPVESSTKTTAVTSALGGVSPSSRHVGSGYQFDFTTPTVTPARSQQQRDELNSSCVTAARQSCPRSTLRTPHKQRLRIPPVISTPVALEREVMPIHVLNSTGNSLSEERQIEESVPEVDEGAGISRHACTPVRELRVLGDDDYDDDDGNDTYSSKRGFNINRGSCGNSRVCNDNSIYHNDDNGKTGGASCTQIGSLSMAGRGSVAAFEMTEQCGSGVNSNSVYSLRSPSFVAAQKGAEASSSSSSSYFNIDGSSSSRGGTITGAVRIYVLHDVPERERLVSACRRLGGSLCSESENTNNNNNNTVGHHGTFWQQYPQQVLLHQVDMAGVIIRVRVVEHSMKDADVLVTHQLTQRESVLAAIAAGLWVVTPKVLQDCEERQSFLPFRDLSVYEWCPELLPPGAPRSSMQLSKQCRSRRQQRQATGTRLFDNKRFVLVSHDTSVSLARMRSMRNVLETGGGLVISVTYKKVNANVEQANVKSTSVTATLGSEEGVGEMQGGSGILLSSPVALLEFVTALIRGKEVDSTGEWLELPSGATGKNCTSLPEKELLVLLDGFVQGKDTKGEIHSVVEVFRHAQAKFREARQHALEKRNDKTLKAQQQRDPMQWGFGMPSSGGSGRDMLRSIAEIRPPLHSLKCSIPPVTFLPTAVDSQEKHNMDEGMPCVEQVQVFTSDWMTLAIQQWRKAPLCAVSIPL